MPGTSISAARPRPSRLRASAATRVLLAALLVAGCAATPGAAPAPGLYEAACAGDLRTGQVGSVRSPELDEISGAVASRSHPGVLWVHEDSGGGARVYAIRTDGRLLTRVALEGASALDWEDIAIGPGPAPGAPARLYVADIGDNEERRSAVTVYRFPEPALRATSARASAIRLRYPDGAHDAEAFLVDPDRGTLVLLTKGVLGAGIYTAGPAGGTLKRKGTLAALGAVTAADISPGGGLVAIRTYLGMTLWKRSPGQGIASVLRGRGCDARLVAGQGEALAFSRSGQALFAISEGERPAIRRIRAGR